MTINEVKTVIDRFEGEKAVLAFGKDSIAWPVEKLPKGAKEGDVIVLVAKKDEDATKDREDLAKTLLNELLRKD